MSTEQNQELFRQVIEEGFNQGHYDVLDAIFAPGYEEHQFGLAKDLAGFKRDIQYLRIGFPDLHLTIEDTVADGNKLWVRMTARGTNLGPMFGKPTGKRMAITFYDSVRFENGRIAEHWGVPDRYALMAQLGLLPRGEAQPA